MDRCCPISWLVAVRMAVCEVCGWRNAQLRFVKIGGGMAASGLIDRIHPLHKAARLQVFHDKNHGNLFSHWRNALECRSDLPGAAGVISDHFPSFGISTAAAESLRVGGTGSSAPLVEILFAESVSNIPKLILTK